MTMTRSEELVYRLCAKSFLSLWSYPNPRGKKDKELCDILVVCDPDIVVFSVKEIIFRDTGDQVGLDRWRRDAIEKSYRQIAGAERWITQNHRVVTRDGREGLILPQPRRVHRIAVALGGDGMVPLIFGDSGTGFVHVFDERSLEIVMKELDTITDFVDYLIDKEAYYYRGKLTLFDGGGEEDSLALYLACDRSFPDEPDFIVLDGDLWETFSRDEHVVAEKKLDEVSYRWDEIIEEMHQTYLDGNLIKDMPHVSTELTDIEKSVRVMARENRLSRRLLSQSLVDFMETWDVEKLKARIADSGISDTRYVFMASDYDGSRKANMGELLGRCIVARGLNQSKTKVVGIGAEFSKLVPGSATSMVFLDIQEWTTEWQAQMDYQQREFGYFTNANPRPFFEQS